MLLRERCQRQNLLGTHDASEWLRARWERGSSIRGRLRELLSMKKRPAGERLGRASRFTEGSWVRVRSQEEVRATLDDQSRLRGLVWIPQQWACCDRRFRVQKVMRRLLDDRGRMRPVSGTVLLEGSTCADPDGTAGCGRSCPLMFRDEWLEEAKAPVEAGEPALNTSDSSTTSSSGARVEGGPRWARIKRPAAIRATLDHLGRTGGLRFMPEMYRYSGQRHRVERRLLQVFESDRYMPPASDIYLLAGLHCTGATLGSLGPCDRSCALLWHGDWLELLDTNEQPEPVRR